MMSSLHGMSTIELLGQLGRSVAHGGRSWFEGRSRFGKAATVGVGAYLGVYGLLGLARNAFPGGGTPGSMRGVYEEGPQMYNTMRERGSAVDVSPLLAPGVGRRTRVKRDPRMRKWSGESVMNVRRHRKLVPTAGIVQHSYNQRKGHHRYGGERSREDMRRLYRTR